MIEPLNKRQDISLEFLTFGSKLAISDMEMKNLSIEVARDERIASTIYAISTKIMGQNNYYRVKRPVSWWDMFKEQYFPDWLLKYFPVVYDEGDIVLQQIKVPEYFVKGDFGQHYVEYLPLTEDEYLERV